MGLQSRKNPNCVNFETPNLGVPKQNDIWVQAMWPSIENTIRGRWWLPPSPSRGESCESVVAHGLFVHEKCSNYALINLLFGSCKSMWIIDLFFTRLSPHPGAPTLPFTLEVLWAKERTPIPYPSTIFTMDLQLNLSRSLGVRHKTCTNQ